MLRIFSILLLSFLPASRAAAQQNDLALYQQYLNSTDPSLCVPIKRIIDNTTQIPPKTLVYVAIVQQNECAYNEAIKFYPDPDAQMAYDAMTNFNDHELNNANHGYKHQYYRSFGWIFHYGYPFSPDDNVPFRVAADCRPGHAGIGGLNYMIDAGLLDPDRPLKYIERGTYKYQSARQFVAAVCPDAAALVEPQCDHSGSSPGKPACKGVPQALLPRRQP